jgi:hypothetical protein
MVAIVRGVDFVAVQTLVICISSSGFAGRWLRFADMRHAAGQAFGQVQKPQAEPGLRAGDRRLSQSQSRS